MLTAWDGSYWLVRMEVLMWFAQVAHSMAVPEWGFVLLGSLFIRRCVI